MCKSSIKLLMCAGFLAFIMILTTHNTLLTDNLNPIAKQNIATTGKTLSTVNLGTVQSSAYEAGENNTGLTWNPGTYYHVKIEFTSNLTFNLTVGNNTMPNLPLWMPARQGMGSFRILPTQTNSEFYIDNVKFVSGGTVLQEDTFDSYTTTNLFDLYTWSSSNNYWQKCWLEYPFIDVYYEHDASNFTIEKDGGSSALHVTRVAEESIIAKFNNIGDPFPVITGNSLQGVEFDLKPVAGDIRFSIVDQAGENLAMVQFCANHSITYFKATTTDYPITINGDANLIELASQQGWLGNGSEESPYEINDHQISTANMSCISIFNTTKYVKISNCVLRESRVPLFVPCDLQEGYISQGPSGYYQPYGGIVLMSCSHIQIVDCEISNTYYGIYMQNCSDIKVMDGNAISNCTMDGIYIVDRLSLGMSSQPCHDIVINGATVESSGKHGIRIDGCYGVTVTNSSFQYNMKDGIHLEYSAYNNTISGNMISHNQMYGVYLATGAHDNNITSNEIEYNALNGFKEYISCFHNGDLAALNTIISNPVNPGFPEVYAIFADFYDMGQDFQYNLSAFYMASWAINTFKLDPANVQVLPQATTGDLSRAFDNVYAKIDSNDIFLFFELSHGMPTWNYFGGYFSNYNTIFRENLWNFQEALDRMNCKEYILLDSCFSGAVSENATMSLTCNNRFIIPSSSANAVSYGMPFDWAFTDAWEFPCDLYKLGDTNHDGFVSMNEASSYFNANASYFTSGELPIFDDIDNATDPNQAIIQPAISLKAQSLSNGNQTLDLSFAIYGAGGVTSITVFTYDSNGNLIQKNAIEVRDPAHGGQGFYANITPIVTPKAISSYGIEVNYTQSFRNFFWTPDPNDNDKDGLSNTEEYYLHTNPNNNDTSGDGMPDGWKVANGLNPFTNDSSEITPSGLTVLQEYHRYLGWYNLALSQPQRYYIPPGIARPDSDFDGISDSWKYEHLDNLICCDGTTYGYGLAWDDPYVIHQPPTTTISFSSSHVIGSDTWIIASSLITLTATTNNPSYIAGMYYKVSGFASETILFNPYGTSLSSRSVSFIALNCSTITISWCSWDELGNNETVHTMTVRVATGAPSTTISYSPMYTKDLKNWVNSSTTFTLTVTENPSDPGVQATFYKWSGIGYGAGNQTWTQYTGPFTLAGMGNGTYTISWCSWDYADFNETLNSLTVYIYTLPTTTIGYTPVYTNGSMNWVNSSTTFTLTATANALGSQVSKTYYKWCGSGNHYWTQYTAPFSLIGMGSGTYTISWCSWDIAGNNETLNSLTVCIDTDTPTTSISSTASTKTWTFENASLSDWYLGNEYLPTISSTHAHSGTYSCEMAGNGSVLSMYADMPFYGHTVYSVEAWVYVTGLQSGWGESAYLALEGSSGSSQPFFVQFRYTGTENEIISSGGVIGTYMLDTWIDLKIVVISTNYANIYVNGVLIGQNMYTESPGVVVTGFRIANYEVGNSIPDVYWDDVQVNPYVGPFMQFMLAATDAGTGESGVASTYYSINSGTWQAYSSPFSLSGYANGTCTINYWSIDNVGNVESTKSITVMLDTIAPTTIISYSAIYTSGSKNWVTTSTAFMLIGTDNNGGSGIASTWYKWNGTDGSKSWTQYNTDTPFFLSDMSNGTYTISWCSVDNAGNTESTKSLTVCIDTDTPTTSISNTVGTKTWTFENASLSDWLLVNEYYPTISSTHAHSGTYSCEMAGNGSVSATYAEIPNYGHAIYSVEAWVYVTGEQSAWAASAQLGLNGLNGDSQPFVVQFMYTGTVNEIISDGNVIGTYTLDTWIDLKIVVVSTNYANIYVNGFLIGENMYTESPGVVVTGYHIGNVEDGTTIPDVYWDDVQVNPYAGAFTQFMLAATDAGTGESGVASTYYSINSGTWQAYSSPFSLSGYANGTCTINYWSIDNVGNVESTKSITVMLDTIAPTTIISYSAIYTSGSKNWVTTSTAFMLIGTDNNGGSGIASTWYKWNGTDGSKSWTQYNTDTPFFLSDMSNGTYTISWCSVDNAGNTESTKSLTVYVDTLAPTTSISYTPVCTSGSMNWVSNATMFTLTATDNDRGSDVNETWYKWSGTGSGASSQTWTLYTGPFTLAGMGNSTCTISWCSWDNAGKNETLNTQVVYIDTIAPTTGISYTPVCTNGSMNLVNSSTEFTLTMIDNDGGSGVQNTWYKWSGIGSGASSQAWTLYTGPFMLAGMGNGTCTISWCSWDNVGNNETLNAQVVYIGTIMASLLNDSITIFDNQTADYSVFIKNNGFVSYNVIIGTEGVDVALVTIINNGVEFNGTLYMLPNSSTIVHIMLSPVADGFNQFNITVTSVNGIYQFSACCTINIDDATPPVLNLWVNSETLNPLGGVDVNFTVTATDPESGIDESWVYLAVGSIVFTTLGTHVVNLSAIDTYLVEFCVPNARMRFDKMDSLWYNVTFSFTVDPIAPTTTIGYTPVYTSGSMNWVSNATMFTLTATDNGGFGVNETWYKWSGTGSGASSQTWTLYTGPFTLAGMGNSTCTISWCSWDNAGKNETLNTQVVYIDTIAPTTGISYTPMYTSSSMNWVNSSTTFTLMPADNASGSGVNETWYRWCGTGSGAGNQAWTQYTGPFSLTGMDNGTFTISWCSWDNAGNNETLNSQVVHIDVIKTSLLNDSLSILDNQTADYFVFIKNDGLVSCNVTIGTEGVDVASVTFINNDVEFNGTLLMLPNSSTIVHVMLSPIADGFNQFNITVTSANENYVFNACCTITIDDTTPPVLNALINSETLNPSGSVAVNFTVTATDPESGIDESRVYIAVGSIMFATLGTHVVNVSAIDTYLVEFCIPNARMRFGKIDSLWFNYTFDFTVDPIAPATTIGYTPVYTSGLMNWVNSSTTFTFTAIANAGGFGVNETWYKWSEKSNETESQAWTQYTGPFTLAGMGNGTYTISWCSWDNAGKNETLNTQVVYIDTIPPTTGISYMPVYTSGSMNLVNSSTTFTLTPADNANGSGVNETWYSWCGTGSGAGNQAWTQYTGPFSLTGMDNGTFTISWCSWDNAGNNETLNSQVVHIDVIKTSLLNDSLSILDNQTADYFVFIKNNELVSCNVTIGTEGVDVASVTFINNDVEFNGTLLMLPNSSTIVHVMLSPMADGFNQFNITVTSANESYVFNACCTITIDDTTPPVLNTWVNSETLNPSGGIDVNFTITAIDPESGIEDSRVYIAVGSVVITTLGTHVVNLPAIGTYPVEFCVPNARMRFGEMDSLWLNFTFDFTVDSIAPTTTIEYTPVYTNGLENWVSNTTTFILTATDDIGGSGVNDTYYRWSGTSSGADNHSWTKYTEPFTLAGMGDGTYTISWCSWDNVGNNETLNSIVVHIGTIMASLLNDSITIFDNQTADYLVFVENTGVVSCNVTIGTEGVNIASVTFVDNDVVFNGTLSMLPKSLTIVHVMLSPMADGFNQFNIVVMSSYENYSFTTDCTITIDDTTPPVINSGVNSEILNPTGGIDINFTITAIDPESGIDMSRVYIIAGTIVLTTLGTHVVNLPAIGTYPVEFCVPNARMRFGEMDSLWLNFSFDFTVDSIAPTTTIGYTPVYTNGSKNWVNSTTTFTLTAADDAGGSGVHETWFKWSKMNSSVCYQAWTQYTGSFTLADMGNGTYTISWCSWDNVGNNETLNSQVVYIETIAIQMDYTPFTTLAANATTTEYVNIFDHDWNCQTGMKIQASNATIAAILGDVSLTCLNGTSNVFWSLDGAYAGAIIFNVQSEWFIVYGAPAYQIPELVEYILQPIYPLVIHYS